MKMYPNDATTALLRGLRTSFGDEVEVHFEEIRSRTWASATFTGARHEVTLRLTGESAPDSAARFTATLGEREFELRGHVVADIALISCEATRNSNGQTAMRLKLEALTVEDC